MSAGYSSKCRTCNSPRRGEIDRRLLSGESARAVSEWLRGEGESIPFQALSNHKASHLDVVEEVRARSIEAATPAFETAVERVDDTLAVLDRITAVAMRIVEAHAPDMAITGGENRLYDPAKVSLFKGCLKEARDATIAKHEIVHGKKLQADVSLDGLGELLALGFDEGSGS
jgi:hypothetical protein